MEHKNQLIARVLMWRGLRNIVSATPPTPNSPQAIDKALRVLVETKQKMEG